MARYALLRNVMKALNLSLTWAGHVFALESQPA